MSSALFPVRRGFVTRVPLTMAWEGSQRQGSCQDGRGISSGKVDGRGHRVKGRIMPLTSDEIDRYARHLVLRDIGGPGQLRLKAARVLVIGAGGLGAPLIQYLAAAGIGTIGIVDDDAVSRSNLQRQVIHGTLDIGRPKVESAAEAAARLNPHVSVEVYATRITAENARTLIHSYDLVADGSDNFETRYAVSDACFQER